MTKEKYTVETTKSGENRNILLETKSLEKALTLADEVVLGLEESEHPDYVEVKEGNCVMYWRNVFGDIGSQLLEPFFDEAEFV